MKASDGLWDRLEEKLDQVPAKEKKPKMVWWRFVAVIILIVNFGAISWMTEIENKVKESSEFKFPQIENQISSVRQHSENTGEIQKSIPIKNSETNHQKLTITNINSSTSELTKKENQITEKVSEKELIIKKEEPQTISQLEEKLAQTDASTPLSTKPRVKYVSSLDLLFGVEIDKAKTETPKSAMGINTIKLKNDSDFPNPKRIKLFGITLYDKDSITTK